MTVPQRTPPPDVPVVPSVVVDAEARAGVQFTRTEITSLVEGPTLWSDRFEDSHEPEFSDRVAAEIAIVGPLFADDFSRTASMFDVASDGHAWVETPGDEGFNQVHIGGGICHVAKSSLDGFDVVTEQSFREGSVEVRFRATEVDPSSAVCFQFNLNTRVLFPDFDISQNAHFIGGLANDVPVMYALIASYPPSFGLQSNIVPFDLETWYRARVVWSDTELTAQILDDEGNLLCEASHSDDYSAYPVSPVNWYARARDAGIESYSTDFDDFSVTEA